jgi:uncharacterized glyoxalase superfamily protein PhnB
MTTVSTYLTFKGNCETAFKFYRMVFGSEFAHIGRFKDMPQDDPNCVIDDSEKNNIMHVSLPIGNSILMGSDAGGGWTDGITIGNNFSVSINTDSKDEAVFGGLFGSLGLILKKKWAKTAFIVSLGGIIPQMIHNLFFTKSIEVYGPGQAAIMPVMVVTFGVFLIWFSKYATHKNWLK